MAEKKDFIIENYNGTDYDTLYPQTNSGQVLLDTDAQTNTHLPSGSTLDDALQFVTKDGGAFQIGDTLTTTRTDLGDDWLLCNGQQITRGEYPVLVDLLGAKSFDWVNKGAANITPNNDAVNKITASNDAFLAASDTKVGNSYYCYSSTDALSWETAYSAGKEISTFVAGDSFIISFVASGASIKKYGNLYKSDNGDWAYINGSEGAIYGATYWNGKYYLSTIDTNLSEDNKALFIYEDLSQLPTILHVSYVGKLVALQNNLAIFYASGSTNYIAMMDAQNSFTRYSFTVPEAYGTFSSFNYFNGYYYAAMYYKPSSIGDSSVTLLRTNSLSGGNWSTIVRDTGEPTKYTTHTITVTDNYLITNSGYYIGKDNVLNKQSNPIIATVPIFVGKDKYYTISETTTYECNIEVSANLPTISMDKTYTYIKAKN